MTAESRTAAQRQKPTRVLRIIARLNIGGPAIQAITLTRRLTAAGYETTLVRGSEEPDEGNMDDLARALDVQPVRVATMRRNPGWRDLPALISLVRIIRRVRPHLVHTHAAKGGTLGRAATLIASLGRPRPVVLHTYHGHSLTGYFAPRTASIFRTIERWLARHTDRLIAVSSEVRDELVDMGVAPASKFEVIPLGFELEPFMASPGARDQMRNTLRAELGIPRHAAVVTLIARLVPIKRVDRFLMAARALHDLPDVWFLIVGDGELRERLRESADARALGGRLLWAGFRQDMPGVCFSSDVVVQTSDNEGTPVSLIEAQAAGLPVVSTNVGGTASVVDDGETGFLVAREDLAGLVAAVRSLCADPRLRARLGRAGQRRAAERFGLARLLEDMDQVYRRELNPESRPARSSP